MSMSTKDKIVAYEVKAKQPLPTNSSWVAEYLFDTLKGAIKFEIGMRKQGFRTEITRKFI